MATYEIVTVDGQEFDGDYSYASVLDSWHQNGHSGAEHVIVTEVDEFDASRYESALNNDSAVIAFSRVAE